MALDETPYRRLTGQCLCGNVRYLVNDRFEYAMNCHCSQCRRATGSAFKPIAGIARDNLSISSGVDRRLIFGDAVTPGAAHDVHCRDCGSLLYSVVRDGHYAHVTMGTLTDAPTISPSMHIFVGSKAAWFEITDDLPQFDGFPGA